MYLLKSLAILKSPNALFITCTITAFKFYYLPSVNFFVILLMSMFLDLVTGVVKAWSKHENTTSEGLRRTVAKATQYFGFIGVGILVLNLSLSQDTLNKYSFLVDTLFSFVVLIELLSICENLIEINPDSKFVIYVIRPFMKVIKGKLK